MIEHDVVLPLSVTITDIVANIEHAVVSAGLAIALRGTVSMYPDSVHWHLKRVNHKGTLELTWWPKKSRLWFKIAGNRGADWMPGAINAINFARLATASPPK